MRLLKIGTAASCDIVLHSNKVSSLHAEITVLNNGDILLEDKNSLNGTFIMNKPITPSTPVSIKRGDAIRFADVELYWDQIPFPENTQNYKGLFGIGTDFRNEIRLSGNRASRFHATLKIDKKGKAFLEDHSLNGTTVNGRNMGRGQQIAVKRTDSVICGGIPVDIKPYLRTPIMPLILKIAATAAVLACLFFVVVKWNDVFRKAPSVENLQRATACVFGQFYYDVILDDDPFAGLISGWPEKWRFGIIPTEQGPRMALHTFSEREVSPVSYTGTAFFISENGEMGTNRHIAVPWKYINKTQENEIRQILEMVLNSTNDYIEELLDEAIEEGIINYDFARANMSRIWKSSIKEITGQHVFLGIIPYGRNFSTVSDLLACQVIAESGNEKQDVAMLRLNSVETPKFIVQNGYYDLSRARVDETSLSPQEENLLFIGYGGGLQVAFETSNASESLASVHRASVSKKPDRDRFQIQVQGVGGFSGSPVIDEHRRLVGVLCSGYLDTEFTYCCNIKHLISLYENYQYK